MNSNLIIELNAIEQLAKADNYGEALRHADRLAASHPQEIKVWTTRGYVHDRQGNYEAAIADLSKAIQLSDKEPHSFYMRGILSIRVARYREAIVDFTKVIELCDFYGSNYYKGPAYFCRADAHLRLGEFEEARLDCSHVRDDMVAWTDRLRTKAEIVAECL